MPFIDGPPSLRYSVSMTKVATTVQKKVRTETRRQVAGALREILSDPDFGASLRPTFVRRLQKSIRSAKQGKSIDLDEFLKK